MKNLFTRGGKCILLAASCLFMLSNNDTAPLQAEDSVVFTSDFGEAIRQPQRFEQFQQPIQPTACNSSCSGAMCCDSCSGGSCCGSCSCCSPWWSHCSGVSGEFLYLHTTDADVAYAQQQNGIGGAGTVPFGRIGSLGPHHEPGFRVGLTKAFTDCSSLVLNYTFFESDSIDALAPGVGGAVGSLVHHPGAALTASFGPVNAAYDVDFQLADIVYRSLWKATKTYAINWSVGGRYGSLTQDFRQLGNYSGGAGGLIETRSNIDFDGGGLMLGLDGERRLGGSGFSIFSKGAVSTLSGRFQADYLLNNNSTGAFPGGVLLALADWEDDRIITVLDLEGGLSWSGPCRKWRASAGYLVSYWFNTLTTSEFINTVQADSYVGADDTLKFEGLTAKIERRW